MAANGMLTVRQSPYRLPKSRVHVAGNTTFTSTDLLIPADNARVPQMFTLASPPVPAASARTVPPTSRREAL
jgi:hypothetical protein